MSDLIQKSQDEVAIVIYDAPLPPKYFRLTKKFIHRLFVVTPVFIILTASLLFLWGLGARIDKSPKPSFSQSLSKEDQKISILEAELKSLQESNAQLTSKIAGTTSVAASGEEPYLLTIKKPYGMQNLISTNLVSLDQFEFSAANKVSLKFQIISTVPERKVSGHVMVFMISQDGLMVYPEVANVNLAKGVRYSEGEPFSVSRLRPTNAEFSHKLTDKNVRFIIYIFSREGDLLLIKETDSFKVDSKQ